MQVMLPVISKEVCTQSTLYEKYVTDNMLCAGYTQGGKGSCYVRQTRSTVIHWSLIGLCCSLYMKICNDKIVVFWLRLRIRIMSIVNSIRDHMFSQNT